MNKFDDKITECKRETLRHISQIIERIAQAWAVREKFAYDLVWCLWVISKKTSLKQTNFIHYFLCLNLPEGNNMYSEVFVLGVFGSP